MLAITTAQDAVERFRECVRSGTVHSSSSDRSGSISPSDANAIISVVAGAFRHASGKSDLDSISYAAFADALPLYAEQDALARGLSDVANRKSRARRFVRTVDGRQRKRGRGGRDAIPHAWVPLYDALEELPQDARRRSRVRGHLVTLAQELATVGIVRPQDLPDANEVAGLLEERGSCRGIATQLLWSYRIAREALLDRMPELPDVDRCPMQSERGIRSLPDIVDRLEAVGYAGPIRDLTATEMMRFIAPRFHANVNTYVNGLAHARGAGWPKHVWGAASRAISALARRGRDLRKLRALDLLLSRVIVERPPEEDEEDDIDWSEYNDGSPLEAEEVERPTVTLLEAIAPDMAVESLVNSPLRVQSVEQDDSLYFTETVIADLGILKGMAVEAASRAPRAIRAKMEAADLEVRKFIKSVKKENDRKRVDGRKRKEAILELITMPQVVCLGLPRLREHVLCLREEWQEALEVHGGDPNAPLVRSGRSRYERWLERYVICAVMTADGLRVQNYANARLGSIGDEEMVTSIAPCGTEVRSYCHIEPRLEDGRITSVRTGFYGKDDKRVKLKVTHVGKTGDWRRRHHFLRPSVVDFDLLLEYLVEVRPHRLVAQGLLRSTDDYNLRRDIDDWHFALFVSPVRSEEPFAAATGAFKSEFVSAAYGAALHWMCVEVLGRDLPPFRSKELRTKYRSLFSAHVSRLLAATYLYGIRQRLTEAMTFIDDTAEVVARRYTVVESSLIGKRGWDDPNFFDEQFDQLWEARERVDFQPPDIRFAA